MALDKGGRLGEHECILYIDDEVADSGDLHRPVQLMARFGWGIHAGELAIDPRSGLLSSWRWLRDRSNERYREIHRAS